MLSLLSRATGSSGSFDSYGWRLYKSLWGIKWDQLGHFSGEADLVVTAGRNYTFKPNPTSTFSFTRATGETVTPAKMITDGGSIPQLFWSVSDFNPWSYISAYLIHDWLFLQHHCDPLATTTFEDANDILAEAVYTLMVSGLVNEDWRVVVAIHSAVNSVFGRTLWDRPWTADQCSLCLN